MKEESRKLNLKQCPIQRREKLTEDKITLERMGRAASACTTYYHRVSAETYIDSDLYVALTASHLFSAFTQESSLEVKKGHLGCKSDIYPWHIDEGLEKAKSVQNLEVRQAIITILETLRDASEILDLKEKAQFISDALADSKVPKVINKIASGEILVPGKKETALQRLGNSDHHARPSNLLGAESALRGTNNYRSNRTREVFVI